MAERPLTTPAGRYPTAGSSRISKRAAVLVLVAGLVVGAGIALAFYLRFGRTPIDTGSASFQLVDDSTVEMTFSVTRDDRNRAAVCIVRARSKQADETGRREVLVPPSAESTTVVHTSIHTSRPPVVAEVYGCGYEVPRYLRSDQAGAN